MAKTLKTYKVILEDGSSNEFREYDATAARKSMNKYLTNYCGYTGRNSGPRPKIVKIEEIDY